MQSQRNYSAVLHAAHLLLKSRDHAAEYFAFALGKSPNTVRNELNPNLPTFKLGLVDAIEMMNLTEVYSLLYQINAMCGFIAVPIAPQARTERKLLDTFCQWQSSVGGACSAIYDAIEDGIITPQELNAITRAGNTKMAQWVNVQQVLQSEAEKHHGCSVERS